MIAETEFHIGDSAWFIHENRATEAFITSIKILIMPDKEAVVQYTARKVSGSVSWLDYPVLQEENLFYTKKLLLDSL